MSNATVFLEQKLLETIGEYGVPGLAAAVVGSHGTKGASGQKGIRKVGGGGVNNAVLPIDKFNLGSVSKVVTGYLMAKLIQDGVAGLKWETTIGSVFPELASLPGWKADYAAATVQQLLSHTAGFPYTPSTDAVDDYKTYTAAQMTNAAIVQRRHKYVECAVVDTPLYAPGGGCVYDGGGIVCAAMAEKLTGKTYEQLVQQYVFAPLGMTHSGFGKLSTPGALDGPWQHTWDANAMVVVPDANTMLPGYSWHPRTPVGGVAMSAADMVAFLKEQIVAAPVVCSVGMRATAQTTEMTGSFVRGGWVMSDHVIRQIWHNGDNGVSYAEATVQLDRGEAYAAMSNMNSAFAAPAVGEMNEVSRLMLANWALFEDPHQSFVACDHPCPALIAAGSQRMVFARKHDGSGWRKASTDGGATWSAAVTFPAAVNTSGLAACASSAGDKRYLFGRDVDKRIWFAHSNDGGTTWQGWSPIGSGLFTTGPAAAAASSGLVVHVVAMGNDHKMYRARSNDGGATWSGWVAIGAGVFTSAPALACSADGQIVHAFGRGNDWRIWSNKSTNGGAAWLGNWSPIGMGIQTSSPAAAASANGAVVHVVSRGTDRRMWRNLTGDGATSWAPHWQPIGSGTFTSAPALATNASGSLISVVALGGDFRLYGNQSLDAGADWGNWVAISGGAGEFFL